MNVHSEMADRLRMRNVSKEAPSWMIQSLLFANALVDEIGGLNAQKETKRVCFQLLVKLCRKLHRSTAPKRRLRVSDCLGSIIRLVNWAKIEFIVSKP